LQNRFEGFTECKIPVYLLSPVWLLYIVEEYKMNIIKNLRWAVSVLIAAMILAGMTGGNLLVHAQEDDTQAQQNILFEDDFTTPGIWATIPDPNFDVGYANGVYEITNDFARSYVSSVRAAPAGDVRVEVDVTHVSGPASGYFGAVCRWQDVHNYYAFVVGSDNMAGIVRIQNGQEFFLAEQTFEFNMDGWTRVGGECAGNTLTLLVDGETVLDVRDGTFGSGAIGMMVGTTGEPGVTAQFDNIIVTQADEEAFPPPVGIIPETGADEQLYIVRPTDTLSEIAVRFDTTVSDLMQRNPHITDPSLIFSGQRLAVPEHPQIPEDPRQPGLIPETGEGEELYTVQATDNLWEIAQEYDTTVADLLRRNPQITDPRLIRPGDEIVVPTVDDPAPTPPDDIEAPFLPDADTQVLFEDFDQVGIWLTDLTPDYQIEYVNGTYRILNQFQDLFVSSVRTFNLPDIHSEVDASLASGPQSGYWGVVCRWQDINNYYAAVVGGDGSTGIVRILNGAETFLAEGTADFANEWSRVGANCYNDTLTLFVNGEAVLQTTDTTFSDGYFGVMVGTRGEAGVDVRFDNLTVHVPADEQAEIEEEIDE
jgi:LysM repeat protein